jgi:NitT/TauT family transport system substrate-binding protein
MPAPTMTKPPRSSSTTTPTGAAAIDHQKRMMGEISKLTEGSDRHARQAAADRTVETLLSSGGEAPVITKKPEGAWTAAVTDKAKGM